MNSGFAVETGVESGMGTHFHRASPGGCGGRCRAARRPVRLASSDLAVPAPSVCPHLVLCQAMCDASTVGPGVPPTDIGLPTLRALSRRAPKAQLDLREVRGVHRPVAVVVVLSACRGAGPSHNGSPIGWGQSTNSKWRIRISSFVLG